MSWISGFADKAEQLLVKIDENAANKLQKKKSLKSYEEAVLTEVSTDPLPASQKSKLTPPQSPIRNQSSTQSKAVVNKSMVNHSEEEEKLIDFLNDNTKQNPESNWSSFKLNVEDNIQNQGEKKLLKNEVRVLNNELSMLLHRTRAAEKESEMFKQDLQDADKAILNLEDELSMLRTKMKALEQNNHILITEKACLEKHSSLSQLTNEQLQQLQSQIQSLQDHQNNMALRLENKEHECAILEASRVLQQQEVESLTQQLGELRNELDQYRARAQQTLSDKETLINQLRANNSSTSVEASFHTELKQLREERQSLLEELQQMITQLDTSRRRLTETEQTLEKVRDSAARTQQELQDRLANETQKRRIIEDDYRIQTLELRLVREEFGQLSVCLREKEGQLSQLRSELSSCPASPTTHLLPGELEMRLSSLTKTLIQKQTMLESATTERNQLRMQLEELEHKYRENLLLLHQARVIRANDTDDAKAQVPSFIVESPFDTGVARRVKQVYSSLDAVSIRTGVFLRRYPLARILVILYVVVLHLLVLAVLCSHTPDSAQK